MRTLVAGALVAAAIAAASGSAAAEPQAKASERILIVTPEGVVSGDGARERVFVMRRGDGPAGERTLRLRPGGEGIAVIGGADCEEKTETAEQDGNRRVRIMVCGKPGQTAEERAARLAEIRARIGEHQHLTPEQRNRIAERLEQMAARLRAN